MRYGTWMKTSSLSLFVAAGALSACVSAPAPALDEPALIHAALIGVYVGQASETEEGSFDPEGIVHSFEPLNAPQFGEYVLFYQIIVDDAASPASQRKIFVLEPGDNDSAARMSAYILGADQSFDPSDSDALASLDPDTLMTFPAACDFNWSATDRGFEGLVRPDACAFQGRVFEGTIRAQMTYNISADTLLWEEALYTGDFVSIVTTDGLQRAVRQPSQ